MLPAHRGSGGGALVADGGSWRRPGKQQQQQQHAAASGHFNAPPPTDPRHHHHHHPVYDDDDDDDDGRRRGVPYSRRHRRKQLLLLLLPLLMLAAVLYTKHSRSSSSITADQQLQRPQSLAVVGSSQARPRPQKQPQPQPAARLRLSTFGKNETGKGETAQIWLTLANEEEEATAEGVALQVYLPHPSLRFHAGSAFPALDTLDGGGPPTPQVIQEEVDLWEDGRRFTLVRFPGAALGPGQSRVYNLEARVEGFGEEDGGSRLRVYAEAVGAAEEEGGGDGGGGSERRRPLAALTVTLGKKHVATNDDLDRKRAARAHEMEKRGIGQVESHWRPFSDCRPYSPLAARMTACFAVCHPKGPGQCLACGYDEAAGACICKTPDGGEERVPIDDEASAPQPPPGGYMVDDLVAEEEEEEEEEEKESPPSSSSSTIIGQPQQRGRDRGRGALTSTGARGRERIAEVLVFPGLISEADCQEMDAYLDALVAREATPRKIIEGAAGNPLHAVLGGAVRAVMGEGGGAVEVLDYVTMAREDVEVSPHYDSVKGPETHKLLLFLDGTAGTRFWETQAAWKAGICPMELPAARGTVVVFPMSLYHDSRAFSPRGALKSTLGLRVVLPAFEGGDTLALVKASAAGA